MNDNNNIIITLCSHMCVGDDVVPLEPQEWSLLAKQLYACKKEPKDIIEFTKDDYSICFGYNDEQICRIKRLLDRNASLTFEIERLNSMGISIVTRADSEYPSKLKRKLGNNCPPLFYYAGDMGILNDDCIGFVGSRTISDNDIDFTQKMVDRAMNEKFSVVSGGAKGVDTIASITAIARGGAAVEFLADSMIKKIKKAENIKAIRDGRLLLISSAKPDAGFNVGMAMQRNKYIYAQSEFTIVVKSDLEKGGTWTGATENLKHNWTKTCCWNNRRYKGNQALIEKGAIPINDDICFYDIINQNETKEVEIVQQSFLDLI